MSIVYKARQSKLDRIVALKILHRELFEDSEFRIRFQREAKALAALSHPNIVTLFDSGFERDITFLVMEYVSGVTLRQLIMDGKLTPKEILPIIENVCSGLDHAHASGIIHRDIKPENIIVDETGKTKITDFGLAKAIRGDGTKLTSLTLSHVIMGTPQYMAPEQLDRPKTVTITVDIFALGVVFYEMLTNELPLGDYDPPSEKGGVAKSIDRGIGKMLEKDPEQRFQRAGDVREAIQDAQLNLESGRGGTLMRWIRSITNKRD